MTDTKKGHSLESLHAPPKKVTLDREQDRQWELIKCTPAPPALIALCRLIGDTAQWLPERFSSDSAEPKMPPK